MLTWALEVSKIFILIGSFWAKYMLFEVKKYRQVIFHETEEGSKIWRGIDLSFQNWHKEFDKSWAEHSKVSKVFTLIGSFRAKYILFEVKKYRRVIFHENEEGCKIRRGIDLSFRNWFKEFDKFWPDHSKVWKIFIWARREIYLETQLKGEFTDLFWKLPGCSCFHRQSRYRMMNTFVIVKITPI